MPSDAHPHLDRDHLDRLVVAGRDLVSELRLDEVLEQLLETARELTGARYAALGVLAEDGRGLARFITSGIDAESRRMIGAQPEGHGVLGLLVDDPRPQRLHDVGAHPQSFGAPAEHPHMSTFLGVPLSVHGVVWGNLYLTNKKGGADFDEHDEQTVVVLAAWAAIAIENARLYERLDDRRDELEHAVAGLRATTEIATALGAEIDLDPVLELVVKRARALVEARSVLLLLRDGQELIVSATAGRIASDAVVDAMPVADTRCGDVLSANAPLRICDVAADGRLDAAQLGAPDARAALVVPMAYRRQVVGVLVAFDRLDDPAGFRDDDEELLRAFATTAATAVVTAQSVEASRLRAAMASAEAERGRWARELHDETLQGLGGLLVLLAGATQGDDGARLQVAAELAVERVADEIANLRSIIAELRPAALDELGLQPALETLVQRAAGAEGVEMTAEIDLDGGQRLPAEMETAVYRVAQEALTNIAKHSGASHVALQVRRSNGAVLLSVADDGAGFDQTAPAAGYGLAVMRERVTLAGGTIDIDSSGAGTVVRARLPVVQDASSRRPWSSA